MTHTHTHTHTSDMWNQTRVSPSAEEWSVSIVPVASRDPICLLSISPGLGDWVCETDNRLSVPSQQRQPATYTPQGLNPVSMHFMDGSHWLKTDSWEWMESETGGAVFFLMLLCVCVLVWHCVLISLYVCVCVCVSVQLCNQPLYWHWQSKHKHHWFLMMWLSGKTHKHTWR